ncbi:MAG: hypothetical protein WCV86_03095 [Patescibacteria group bacterium]|jgi:hypothetical protein
MRHLPFVILGLFFVGTAFTALFAGQHFTSPDEVVNAAAAQQFAEEGTMTLGSALPEDTAKVFRPRNIEIVDGAFVPSSYLSFPLLLGSMRAVFGENATLLLTPLLATLGLLAFFGIVKYVWNFQNALLSLFLLAFSPGILFFTIKGHWHNIAFISVLLCAAWLGIYAYRSKRIWFIFLCGLILGFGISLRANEVVWVGVFILIAWWRFLRREKIIYTFLLLFGIGIGILPLLALNDVTFGGPFSFGYTAGVDAGIAAVDTGLLNKLFRLMMPVATHVALYRTTIQWYGLELFPLFTFLAALGVLFVVFARRVRGSMLWLSGSILLAVWLFWYYAGTPYYGASTSSSHPIIGSSFVRYFLPLTVLFTPLAAHGMQQIIRSSHHAGKYFAATLLVAFFGFSLHLVIFEKENGLSKFFQKDIPQITEAAEAIKTQTPSDALIIAGAKDKLFFPARRVMGYNEISQDMRDLLPKLLGTYSIYYNDIAARDVDVLSDIATAEGYLLVPVGMIGQDPLYSFEPMALE